MFRVLLYFYIFLTFSYHLRAENIQNIKLEKNDEIKFFFPEGAQNLKYVLKSYYPINSKITLGSKSEVDVQSSLEGDFYYTKIRKHGHKATEIYLTTNTDWVSINSKLSNGFEKEAKSILPDFFKDIIELSNFSKNEKTKIENTVRIFQSKMKYEAPLIKNEESSVKPKSLHEIARSRRGDCKDYALSLMTIFRSMGFESYVAVTKRAAGNYDILPTKEFENFPSAQIFNHAVVLVKTAKENYWIDATNNNFILDKIEPDISGSYALVLDSKSDLLSYLPK